ncbi:MAG: tetratricopeptide repeat protein [Thermoanaerobaculia bacterium]|nr:tetratricopeptide repeat protein [Thermoanaerobaculia bacterium]
MKQVLVWLFILHSLCLYTQRTVRCLVLNHSYDPPRPEKFAKLTPLNGGHTVEQGTEAGIFELKISGIAAGKPLELIFSKEGYQLLGPNPSIFTYAMPADENDVIRIAIIKSSDFDSRKADYEKAIEKRIKQANQALLDSIARRQSQHLSDDERAVLTKFIGQQNTEIEELRKSKDELATRLAQLDLDQTSDFARLALEKFREEGDVKAALALVSDEKLDTFWESVLSQEEKVRRARQQGVENYMIRARLLIADFQFSLAYQNYLKAVEKDSVNFDILWEVAVFLDEQNQGQGAIALYEKALIVAKTDAQRGAVLNNLGNLFRRNNQKIAETEKTITEALSIFRELAVENPDAFLPAVALALINLSVFYNDNQDIDKSFDVLKDALDIYEQLNKNHPNRYWPEVALITVHVGDILHEIQDVKGAEESYAEALSIYRLLSKDSPNSFLPYVANTLARLGYSYFINQKSSEAEAAYIEALDIQRQLAEKNPDAYLPELATILGDLGMFYNATQKMTEAEMSFNEALRIHRQLAVKDPDAFMPNAATILNYLGAFHYSNQNKLEAENSFNEAQSIYRKLAVKNPNAFLPDMAEIFYNLGLLYLNNQQLEEAEKAFDEALEIYERFIGKNALKFASPRNATLKNLGYLNKVLKRYSQSLDHYEDVFYSLEYDLLSGEKQVLKEWVEVLNNIYTIQDSTKYIGDYTNFVRATQLVAESCDSLQKIDEWIKDRSITEYGALSRWALFARDYPLAERAARRCLELDPERIWVQANIGHSYLLRGDTKKAKAAYLTLKGKTNGSKNYKTTIEEDFQALEAENITHPGIAEIRKWLREEW